MGNVKAEMFNRKASDPKNKPGQVLESLGLQAGDVVLDIGAGGGYFSLRFAKIVGANGEVYAADVNREFLQLIKENAEQSELANVQTMLVGHDGVSLPEKSIDLVFMRNVYHHLPKRVEYLKKLLSILKPGGRIAVIEYFPGGFSIFRRLFGHHTPKATITKELREAGYKLTRDFDFLPEQSFQVFSR
ncbi:MAG: class I SAM-dependent methyltransferase [Candidatus Micrarchaeota archaeon]